MLLSKLIEEFERLWPTHHAESWDVVGLVSGNPSQNVQKILLTVDLTMEVVEQAKELKVDLIFAHHPFLLRGITNLSELTAKGAVLSELIRNGIAVYSAHTNADSAVLGTSAYLAKEIGLVDVRPLVPNQESAGIGSVGQISAKTTLGQLAARLNEVLAATATGVRVTGDFDREVSTVALCAGAGDNYLQAALDSGADVYITSDLRHHPALEILEQAKARSIDFSLIDISHWAAEYVWLEQAKREISELKVDVEISDIRTDVFDFLVNLPRGEK